MVKGLFFGLKAAVLAIVINAVVCIGKRALRNNVMLGIAAAVFLATFFLDITFPLIILGAALIGFVGGKAGSPLFRVGGGHGPEGASGLADGDSLLGAELPDHAQPNRAWSLRISAICLTLWLTPVVRCC
nr:hypothetical protein [Halomonas zhangzhouensis]